MSMDSVDSTNDEDEEDEEDLADSLSKNEQRSSRQCLLRNKKDTPSPSPSQTSCLIRSRSSILACFSRSLLVLEFHENQDEEEEEAEEEEADSVILQALIRPSRFFVSASTNDDIKISVWDSVNEVSWSCGSCRSSRS